MIIKDTRPPIETPRPAVSRGEMKELLIELWSRVLEAELRAHLAGDADDDRQSERPQ